MAGFAALAVLLSIVGIYGVLSYLVSNRTREIGIRICLGAQRERVAALLVRQLSISVAAGLLGGFLVSLLVARLLSRWLFAIRPNDPMTSNGCCAVNSRRSLAGQCGTGLASFAGGPAGCSSRGVRMRRQTR